MKPKAVHFGQPGHFCDAKHCRWHLHTHVGPYCVSSVGDYWPKGATAPEMVGWKRLYETMVFRLDAEGEAANYAALDCAAYNTRDDANAGHAREVERWAAIAEAEEGGAS